MNQESAWISGLGIGGQIANIIIAALTLYLWREAKWQRESSQRPLLVPCKLDALPKIAGGLFCGNFSYPRDDEFKHTGLLFIGIKNIGIGVAQSARVESFSTGGSAHPDCGYQLAQIPPGETVPLVIRYGYRENSDLDAAQNVLIAYLDVFGRPHYLQVQLWFEPLKEKKSAEATVIRYAEHAEPLELPPVPIFREMEWRGHFELQKLAKDHKLS